MLQPLQRPRRNRKSATIRSLVRETRLTPEQLIMPFFIIDGENIKTEVASMPGNYRMSLDHLLIEIGACIALGVKSFMLFPVVDESLKDSIASYSCKPENYLFRYIKTIKEQFPEACIITDVAMDPYSSDGHDGVVENGEILNDLTLPILAEMAIAQATAGADIVGPSDMMDSRVEFLRDALDNAGFTDVGIMSYSVKYASAFYGPFRDALSSAPKAGDKKTYQMDPANRREALREAFLDEQEGADFLIVKPALCYLDIISDLKQTSNLPIAAYNVSGECAMLTAACQNGWLDFEKAMPEMLESIHRAGADIVITYFAKQYAELYHKK